MPVKLILNWNFNVKRAKDTIGMEKKVLAYAAHFDSLYKINDQTPSRSTFRKEQFISPLNKEQRKMKKKRQTSVPSQREQTKSRQRKKSPEFYLKRERELNIYTVTSWLFSLKAFYAPPETPLSVIIVCTQIFVSAFSVLLFCHS